LITAAAELTTVVPNTTFAQTKSTRRSANNTTAILRGVSIIPTIMLILMAILALAFYFRHRLLYWSQRQDR